ncbi:hypothetical protein GF324_08245, partial [bacterium]|nr:hypothetical protein [bacterium]
PFQWLFPDLGKLNFGQAEFRPGPGVVAWATTADGSSLKTSPLICYEAIFPDLGRDAAKLEANTLLNLTNDGWLDGTTEPEQHLLLSRVGSIETGRTLVRATNTGISAFVTPDGSIHHRLPLKTRGGAVMDIPPPVHTLYLRGGWRFGALTTVAVLALYAYLLLQHKLRKDRKGA